MRGRSWPKSSGSISNNTVGCFCCTRSLKQGTAFTVFTEAELIEATDNFADKNILGRGGFGTVYRGLFKDDGVVAVKRCVSSMASEQQKKEFGKEMLILSQINHKNIVKLLGCCLEVEVPMLVYEFIAKNCREASCTCA
jgi:serine/threonine protein kinase